MVHLCFECNEPAEHDHHVIPRSLGGTKTIPLCSKCHGKVHDTHLTSISALTKEALRVKKENGEYCGGRPPYGKKIGEDGIHLVPCETEERVIRLAAKIRDDLNLSMRKVASELNRRGLTQRDGQPWNGPALSVVL